ncbi:hypothetical protein Tco_0963319, partial [Tanacetum coccineum]
GRSMGAKQGAGFGIGGKIGKGLYKLGCDRERLKMIKGLYLSLLFLLGVDLTLIWLRLHTLFHPVSWLC